MPANRQDPRRCFPNLSELDAAIRDASQWSLLAATLYNLCKRHPGHGDLAASNAKVWLIARSLASRIEPMVVLPEGASNQQGLALTTLCAYFYRHRARFDELVGPITRIHEPLDLAKLARIVAAHGAFCSLLSGALREEQWACSFAGKYLHYHCPAVPIFDTFARRKLNRLCPWGRTGLQGFPWTENMYWDYYKFTLQFLRLYDAARRVRPNVNVRLLDLYLLW